MDDFKPEILQRGPEILDVGFLRIRYEEAISNKARSRHRVIFTGVHDWRNDIAIFYP